ncbi:MAG: hypothetical protein OEY89_18580 [Gammaproteobacteria bacterium]|nr:hypothetical protein [Gammaproteobacteria bacterium]
MSLNRYAKPLVLDPVFSRILSFVLLVIHFLSIAALFFPMHLHIAIRVVIFIIICISAWKFLYQYKITDIKTGWWKSHGEFEIELISGSKINAKLLPGSIVTEWLVILHFNCNDNKKRYWLLMNDALDVDIYRRLCVRLRQFSFDAETALF